MKKTVLALIAVAGISAATNANAGIDTLYLGIDATGGAGSSTNIVVNLGSVSSLSSPNPVSTFNLGSDLSAIYGNDWATRTDLYWGIFGYNDNNNHLYASAAAGTGGLTGSDYYSQGGAVVNGSSLAFQYDLDKKNGHIGLASGVVYMSTTEDGAWSQFSYGGSGFSFNLFRPEIEVNIQNALDVISLPVGDGVQGTPIVLNASINSSGTASVPEPSTYALLGFGTLLLIVAYRRAKA
jgi:PEP-CTERM motif